MESPSSAPDPAREGPTNRDWRRFVGRAWAGTCPRCGRGALFRSTFRLAAACASCGLVYRRESGGMTGQMTLTAVATELLAGALILLIFFATDWGVALSLAVSVPIVVLFGYWFLPRAMALWVVIEFMTDIGNREPWTRA